MHTAATNALNMVLKYAMSAHTVSNTAANTWGRSLACTGMAGAFRALSSRHPEFSAALLTWLSSLWIYLASVCTIQKLSLLAHTLTAALSVLPGSEGYN
jgi:hypothetical protein